ncbi:spore-associated protein A [Streptomyces sp. NPDC059101]|uniref:spore-associated protein A n=1 Tax=Streptomyces sp. NPDC059101 TaxID=3346728 RepID=UPI0036B75E63
MEIGSRIRGISASTVGRRVATFGAVAGIAAASVIAVPGTANAAPIAGYNGVCGPGFTVIDSLPVGNEGTVYLTYQKSSGSNCAVSIRKGTGGTVPMSVFLMRSDDSSTWISDEGDYTTYAGPVWVNARGACVDWGGVVGGGYSHRENDHCG